MSMGGLMSQDEFRTIANVGEGTYSEKRSKFLAFAHHVESAAEMTTASPAARPASQSSGKSTAWG